MYIYNIYMIYIKTYIYPNMYIYSHICTIMGAFTHVSSLSPSLSHTGDDTESWGGERGYKWMQITRGKTRVYGMSARGGGGDGIDNVWEVPIDESNVATRVRGFTSGPTCIGLFCRSLWMYADLFWQCVGGTNRRVQSRESSSWVDLRYDSRSFSQVCFDLCRSLQMISTSRLEFGGGPQVRHAYLDDH